VEYYYLADLKKVGFLILIQRNLITQIEIKKRRLHRLRRDYTDYKKSGLS